MIRVANALSVAVLTGAMVVFIAIPAATPVIATQGSVSMVERDLEAPEAATAVGDLVVVQDPNGVSYGLDLASGVERWRFDGGSVGYFAPFMLVDRLLIGNNAGDIHVLDPATGTLLWAYTGTSLVYPPVSDGTSIYAGGTNGSLFAFDPASGEQRWATRLLEWGVVGPALANGRLVVSSRATEELIAVDAATGREIWRTERLGLAHLPPVATGDVVITGMPHLQVTDAATGELLCASDDVELRNFAPISDSGIAYASFADGGVGAYDTATCKALWSQDVSSLTVWPPIVDDGILFVSSPLYRLAAAFDAQSGQMLWEVRGTDADSYLYFGAGGGVAYIAQGFLEAADGASANVLWRFSATSALASNPLRTGNIVIAGALDGTVFALNADSGEARWQFQAAASESPGGMGPRA